jgi:hypothetical protein
MLTEQGRQRKPLKCGLYADRRGLRQLAERGK